MKLTFLDLVPVTEGGSVAASLAEAAALAAHVERLGFARYWVAEHHGMPGIASAATALVIGHVAAATATIRVGAGGIMLPNHAPLVIAEQFGTLDALHPGRIDLGLGRAPGSDGRVAHALRRTLASSPDAFVQDVLELQSYFADDGRTGIAAVPGAGADVRLVILGSSLYGAQVAAALGLPYAFASHFAPQLLDEALAVYRRNFRPSAGLDRPHAMAGFNIYAAADRREAEYRASSAQQAMLALRSGSPGRLPPPIRDFRAGLGAAENAMLDSVYAASAVGPPDAVRAQVDAFVARTGVDELVVSAMMFDPDARKDSLTLAVEALRSRVVA